MNHALMLVRDNAAISWEAIESVLAQTVPVRLFVIDNGSTDSATQMLNTIDDERVEVAHYHPGKGVAESWNIGLRRAFDARDESLIETFGVRGATDLSAAFGWAPPHQPVRHVLVVNNDVLLRPDALELLLADGGDFVTCVGVQGRHYGERRNGLKVFRDGTGREVFPAGVGQSKRPHPDFSCFLIRRAAWDAVGEFDEGFRGAFGEDWDYHVRLHRAGVDAHCIDVPFLHYGSATIKGAVDAEARRIADMAGVNRGYFKSKWGVEGASPEYYAMFGSEPPATAPSPT